MRSRGQTPKTTGLAGGSNQGPARRKSSGRRAGVVSSRTDRSYPPGAQSVTPRRRVGAAVAVAITGATHVSGWSGSGAEAPPRWVAAEMVSNRTRTRPPSPIALSPARPTQQAVAQGVLACSVAHQTSAVRTERRHGREEEDREKKNTMRASSTPQKRPRQSGKSKPQQDEPVDNINAKKAAKSKAWQERRSPARRAESRHHVVQVQEDRDRRHCKPWPRDG